MNTNTDWSSSYILEPVMELGIAQWLHWCQESIVLGRKENKARRRQAE